VPTAPASWKCARAASSAIEAALGAHAPARCGEPARRHGVCAGTEAGDAAAPDAGSAVPSYDIFAIGDPKEDVTKYRVRFPRFELRDHTGTFYTANGASQVSYRAVKR
jgi:hypothetical protein